MPDVDLATDRAERPNLWPWPPILVGLCAAAAVALDHVLPTGAVFAVPDPVRAAGVAVAAVGLGLDLWAIRTMRRHRANILPHRAATALVTTGPFAFSRNPIYLANGLLLAGAGLALANAWLLPAALAQMALVTRLAIRREEAHLAIRFGDGWTAYAAAVPRWLRLG